MLQKCFTASKDTADGLRYVYMTIDGHEFGDRARRADSVEELGRLVTVRWQCLN